MDVINPREHADENPRHRCDVHCRHSDLAVLKSIPHELAVVGVTAGCAFLKAPTRKLTRQREYPLIPGTVTNVYRYYGSEIVCVEKIEKVCCAGNGSGIRVFVLCFVPDSGIQLLVFVGCFRLGMLSISLFFAF